MFGTPTRSDVWLPMAAWIVVISSLAGLLFGATVATFDRCLGRISDDATRPPSSRPGRTSLTTAELLALVPSVPGEYEEDIDMESSESDNDDD
jgi:hypothetical protein